MSDQQEIEQARRRAAKERTGWAMAGVVTLLYALSVAVPWRPGTFGADFGPSSYMILHEVFAAKILYGIQIFFSYGPYGFVMDQRYHPSTYSIVLCARIFFAILLWRTVWLIGRGRIRNAALSLLWMLAVIALAAAGSDTLYLSLSLLAFVYYFHVEDRAASPTLIALTVAIGWASLIKFNYLLWGVLVMGTISVNEVARKRRPPWPLLMLLVAVIAFWVAGGQSLRGLWPFVVCSFRLGAGYEAMAADGPVSEIVWFVVVAVLLLGLLVDAEWRRRGRWAALPLLTWAAMLYTLFKHAFIRHDVHAVNSTAVLLMATLLAATVAWPVPQPGARRPLSWACLAVATGLFCLSLIFHSGTNPLTFFLGTLQSIRSNVAAAVRLTQGRAPLQLAFEHTQREIRDAFPLPPINGDVNVYPAHQAIAFAHGLRYRPQPLTLSHVTYDRVLSEMDALFLRDDGPENVLLAVAPIDMRYPSLEDSLSWPELWTRYDPVATVGLFMLMKRSAQPRSFTLTPAGEIETGFDQRTTLTNAGPVWVQMDIQPSWLGRAASLLLKRPNLFITVRTRDEEEITFRLIAPMARTGFLLSPLVGNAGWFGLMTSKHWQQELDEVRITEFSIFSSAPRWARLCFQPQIRVRLFQLDFPRSDLTNMPGLYHYAQRVQNISRLGSGAAPTSVPPHILTGADGLPVLLARAPMQIVMPVRAGAKKLIIGFGMMKQSWKEGATDGVEFRVSILGPNDQLTPLWSRHLDPVHQEADRDDQHMEITLPASGASKLLLETLTGPSDQFDLSYWSQARTE